MSSLETLPKSSELQPHARAADEVLVAMKSSESGLSAAEAQQRLAEHGPNVIKHGKRETPLALIGRQVNNPLIWVLLGSSVLAILMGKTTDGLVVLCVVVLNTLIGFIQELRAGKAIEALNAMVPQTATVIRAGRRISLPAAELVPGDVAALTSGDQVPADVRLLSIRNLRIDEAPLTGESVPVEKQTDVFPPNTSLGDRRNMAYGGTLVTYGTATAVVVATADDTELGRISSMLRETSQMETPLTRQIGCVAKWLTIAILVLAALLVVVGRVRGYGWGDAVLAAIALAVGAIPEGLPAIITIALAIGVQRMARRQAIIRRLPAVETLGSTTVICSDKTGTLTRNEMTVQEVWTPHGAAVVTGVGYEPHGEFQANGTAPVPAREHLHELLLAGTLCNEATVEHKDGSWVIQGDPTEAALVVAARKLALEEHDARPQYPRADAIPFESERQYMATLHARPESGQVIYMKGAPEVVLERCQGVDEKAVHGEVEHLASRGMRVLALAVKRQEAVPEHLSEADVADGFTLLGLVGMIDPPRPEAIVSIQACHDAGITVKMITGDHASTAEAIGRKLGLLNERTHAISGTELSGMTEAQIRQAALATNVFARVAPEHKLALVRAIQSLGHVVAMTGDGVNDAPALRQADIGVAMGITGTAVSKEAAAVVLADDNFASIAAAVEEGRRVYDNLIKSLAFVLPTNLGLALILLAAVFFLPLEMIGGSLSPLLPMAPTQLLWINLVATVALALPLAFEAMEPNIMRRPPRKPDAPVLSGFVITRTILVALLMTAGAIGLFLYEYYTEIDRGIAPAVALAEAQTMAVTTVILFQIFYLLNCRSLSDSIFEIGLFSNLTIYAGIALLLMLQLAFVYVPSMHAVFGSAPLNANAWMKSLLVGLTVLPLITIEKWFRNQRSRRNSAE